MIQAPHTSTFQIFPQAASMAVAKSRTPSRRRDPSVAECVKGHREQKTVARKRLIALRRQRNQGRMEERKDEDERKEISKSRKRKGQSLIFRCFEGLLRFSQPPSIQTSSTQFTYTSMLLVMKHPLLCFQRTYEKVFLHLDASTFT